MINFGKEGRRGLHAQVSSNRNTTAPGRRLAFRISKSQPPYALRRVRRRRGIVNMGPQLVSIRYLMVTWRQFRLTPTTVDVAYGRHAVKSKAVTSKDSSLMPGERRQTRVGTKRRFTPRSRCAIEHTPSAAFWNRGPSALLLPSPTFNLSGKKCPPRLSPSTTIVCTLATYSSYGLVYQVFLQQMYTQPRKGYYPVGQYVPSSKVYRGWKGLDGERREKPARVLDLFCLS